MAFKDFSKVKIRKQPTALNGMSKETAYRKFVEKCALKKELRKQMKKCEDDLMKYYLTMTKK